MKLWLLVTRTAIFINENNISTLFSFFKTYQTFSLSTRAMKKKKKKRCSIWNSDNIFWLQSHLNMLWAGSSKLTVLTMQTTATVLSMLTVCTWGEPEGGCYASAMMPRVRVQAVTNVHSGSHNRVPTSRWFFSDGQHMENEMSWKSCVVLENYFNVLLFSFNLEWTKMLYIKAPLKA